ncbi:hypothetical protein [Aquimarina sp. AU474]|uniref:hypothetical protein n=1 Tax=Aquimarina sp. AU474 TaxID=2108529 RepID=UPI000D699555|nr:hypothetical protein [Aquimarina sp. AU474]
MKTLAILIVFLCHTYHGCSQNTEDKSIDPYESLSFLIGTWTLDFGKGQAYMKFEWGTNNRYVICTGTNKRNGKITPEFFSLILWDGVQEKFTISSSYTATNDLMAEYGTMTITDQLISRDLTVNYSKGQNIPFLKKKAGNGGDSLVYRQRWQIIDQTTMTDLFEVNFEGQWTNPMQKSKDQPHFKWKKIILQ